MFYFHSIITIEPNDNLSAFANSIKTSTHLTDDDDDDDRDADFLPPKHPSTQAQGRDTTDLLPVLLSVISPGCYSNGFGFDALDVSEESEESGESVINPDPRFHACRVSPRYPTHPTLAEPRTVSGERASPSSGGGGW